MYLYISLKIYGVEGTHILQHKLIYKRSYWKLTRHNV